MPALRPAVLVLDDARQRDGHAVDDVVDERRGPCASLSHTNSAPCSASVCSSAIATSSASIVPADAAWSRSSISRTPDYSANSAAHAEALGELRGGRDRSDRSRARCAGASAPSRHRRRAAHSSASATSARGHGRHPTSSSSIVLRSATAASIAIAPRRDLDAIARPREVRLVVGVAGEVAARASRARSSPVDVAARRARPARARTHPPRP